MNNMKMKGLLIGSLPASALASIIYDFGFFCALGLYNRLILMSTWYSRDAYQG